MTLPIWETPSSAETAVDAVVLLAGPQRNFRKNGFAAISVTCQLRVSSTPCRVCVLSRPVSITVGRTLKNLTGPKAGLILHVLARLIIPVPVGLV